MPRQDAAVIGGIVGERVTSRESAVDPHRDRARIRTLTRHRVRVPITAGIVEPAATHVVPFASCRRVAVLAIELLRRRLDEEAALLHVGAREPRGPRDAILEVPPARAVHL